MAYEDKRNFAFKGETKSLIAIFATFGIMFVPTLIFYEEGQPQYWLAIIFVFALGVVWLLSKRFMPPIPCTSCSYDLRQSIMSLGKAANKGFCPGCGSEIV